MRGEDKLAFVTELFDRIATSYDAVNDAIALGFARAWRSWSLMDAFERGDAVLDVGCGPGNVTRYCMYTHLAHMAIDVTGVDCSTKMLDVARARCVGGKFVVGDAGKLAFADGSFDVATTVYTLRNFSDLGRALDEMYRCVKPGGKMLIVDAFPPSGVFGVVLRLWLNFMLPLLGWLLTRDAKPYAYLAHSIQHTATPKEVKSMLESMGAERVTVSLYWPFGAAAKIVAYKPSRRT